MSVTVNDLPEDLVPDANGYVYYVDSQGRDRKAKVSGIANNDAFGTAHPARGGQGKLAATVAASEKPNPKILLIGDSLAFQLQVRMSDALEERFGIQGLGPQAEILKQVSGGANTNTSDFTNFPDGRTATVPAGGELTFELTSQFLSFEASEAKLYYVKSPGAGTFKVQDSYNGGAYVDVVASVDADGVLGGGVVTIPLTRGLHKLKVVGLTGTVTVQSSPRVYTTGVAGVHFSCISHSGISLEQMLVTDAALIGPAMADIAPDVVIILMSETSVSGVETSLPLLYAKLNTAIGHTPDWIFVGNTSKNTAIDRHAERRAMSDFARSVGQNYISGYDLVYPDLYVDNTHPNDEGYRVIANHLVYQTPPISTIPVKWRRMASDSTTIQRGSLGMAMLQSVNRVFRLTPISLAASATTGASAVTAMSGDGYHLQSGSVGGGYGAARLMREPGSFKGGSSTAGINFTTPMRLAASLTMNAKATGAIRFVVGGNGGVPPAGDANAFTQKGFGVEIKEAGVDISIRLVAHDGTTYRIGNWVPLQISGTEWLRSFCFLLESDGAGNIALFRGDDNQYGAVPNDYPLSVITGPTGVGSGSFDYVEAHVVNDAAGTANAQLGVWQTMFEMVR